MSDKLNINGLQLKRLRKKRKITQQEMGKYILCDRSNISRIETGDKKPTAEEFYSICQILKLTSEEIELVTKK